MSAEARLQAFLGGLDPAKLAALARRYERLARQDGAYVTLADGVTLAIPPVLTPFVQLRADREALSHDSHALVSMLSRAARAVLLSPATEVHQLLLGPLSDYEREAMQRTHADAEQLATVRVDFLVGTDGLARALEVNATIPAMQGYSDAIAAAFLRALGEARGLGPATIEAAIADNGRNTDDLLHSLLAKHARATGRKLDGRRRSIAIVARRGDSQSGELDHYVRRWRALGHEVVRVTPDQITRGPNGVIAGGVTPDLMYRHIFLRRIEPSSELGQLLLEPTVHRIWNPPASHLELKGMLGILSAAGTDDAEAARLGFSDEERATLVRRLPWTRLLVRGATRGPGGEPIDDLFAFTRTHQRALVVKRSWDYGGRGVFLGAELEDQSSQARLRELTGATGDVGWLQLIEYIERSGEGWVVQALVDVRPQELLRVDDTGPQLRTLFRDLSSFTSLGDDTEMSGGAVRASAGRIVNIQGGGGLAPLLRDEALARLLDAT